MSTLMKRSAPLCTRITDYSSYLSPLSKLRQPSAIRKLMPLMQKPGMVSLGGGLPNGSLFPFQSLSFDVVDPFPSKVADQCVSRLSLSHEELKASLQYSPTPGLPGLVHYLEALQKREHGLEEEDFGVSVTVGSQDGLCKAFEMLLDPSVDELLLESPTYSGALAFLHPFGCKLTPVSTDEHGLDPDDLERVLESSPPKRNRVLYTVPTAQNPSGASLSNERREKVYELAQVHDFIIMEDDPYFFLHPQRSEVKSFLSLDTDGRVVRFDSFSKLISSGLRTGFVTGAKPLMERLNLHIQATNLHNSGVSQAMTLKLLEHWGEDGFNEHAKIVAAFYTDRRDALLAAADKHLDGLAEWYTPPAGMFLWFKLLGIPDTKALIEEKAANANVLFVPGQSFCPLNKPSPYIRASYSIASDDEMDLAMERLAILIKGEAS